MRRRRVVTCFLQYEARILLLRRSSAVRTYSGKWAGVSGSIESSTPLGQAKREIQEEVGLEKADVQLLRHGEPLDVSDAEQGLHWRVPPFLFVVRDPSLIWLNWEHVESRWVDPAGLGQVDSVPMLRETWEQL